jgi:hypothetical protein
MLAALIAGERTRVRAQPAPGRMRAKRSVLEEAFTGFHDHHVFLLARMWPGWLCSTLTSRNSTTSSRS